MLKKTDNLVGEGFSYGHGHKSLIDTKFKKAEKPDWFSTKLTFGQYEHPSKEVVQKNEFLIEGIFDLFFGSPDTIEVMFVTD